MKLSNLVLTITLFAGILFRVHAQTSNATIFSNTPFTDITKTNKSTDWNKKLGSAVLLSHFKEGAAIYQSENKVGFVGAEGSLITAAIFDHVYLYHQGFAAVQKNEKWTYINIDGHKLTAFVYDWLGNFEGHLAPVMKKGKWGVLNHHGKEIDLPAVSTSFRKTQSNARLRREKGGWVEPNWRAD